LLMRQRNHTLEPAETDLSSEKWQPMKSASPRWNGRSVHTVCSAGTSQGLFTGSKREEEQK